MQMWKNKINYKTLVYMEKKKRSGFVFANDLFELSTDYELLWELIQQGKRIPGWIVYTAEYDEPIWDIVEIKPRYKAEGYMMGYRGHGFEDFNNTLESFKKNCEFYSLHFIKPNLNVSKNQSPISK